jgi:hypothetical protein
MNEPSPARAPEVQLEDLNRLFVSHQLDVVGNIGHACLPSQRNLTSAEI